MCFFDLRLVETTHNHDWYGINFIIEISLFALNVLKEMKSIQFLLFSMMSTWKKTFFKLRIVKTLSFPNLSNLSKMIFNVYLSLIVFLYLCVNYRQLNNSPIFYQKEQGPLDGINSHICISKKYSYLSFFKLNFEIW